MLVEGGGGGKEEAIDLEPSDLEGDLEDLLDQEGFITARSPVFVFRA